MADPLSVAASIAGVVTLADIVFIRVIKYSRAVKNADKDMKALCTEVNLLFGALQSLSQVARGFNESAQNSRYRIHQIEECNRVLNDLKREFPDPDQNQKSVTKRLRWPLTSIRTKETLTELAGFKDNIMLSLQSTTLDALLQSLTKAEAIQIDVRKTLEITSRIEEDDKTEKLRSIFLISNPQPRYQTSLSLRHPRTGLWLERTPEIQNWLSAPNSRLWLSGIAGAGKTVLAGTVIQHALSLSSETTCTAFFFCDYKDNTSLTPITILGALAFQIAIQSEPAYVHLRKYFDSLRPSREMPRDPSPEDLILIMEKMLECYSKAFIIIDGLDECGSLALDVLETLSDLLDCSDTISLAILSRDETDIRETLGSWEPTISNIEIAAHTEDIQEYVSSEIQERIRNGRLRIDDPSLKDSILTELVDGSNGMFRWVACQLDHLECCISDEECRQALRRLPPNLEETYLRILKRVPQDRRSLVTLALSFIMCTELPIDLLREALSFSAIGNEKTRPSDLIRTEGILRLCSSLIRKSTDSSRLELAHFSVEEFLKGSTCLKDELEQFSLGSKRAETKIAVHCLSYIQIEQFAFRPGARKDEIAFLEKFVEDHPLFSWASSSWLEFAVEVWDNEEILTSAKSLFRPENSPNLALWTMVFLKMVCNKRFNSLNSIISLVTNPDHTPLHLAALICVPNLCSYLISLGNNVNHMSLRGTPLIGTIRGSAETSLNMFHKNVFGSIAIASFTWEKPDSLFRSNYYPSIWQSPAYSKTLQCLRDAGASFGPFPELGRFSLLHHAFSSIDSTNSLNVAIFLLENGYDLLADSEDIEDIVAPLRSRDPLAKTLEIERFIRRLAPLVHISSKHSDLFKNIWQFGVDHVEGFACEPLEYQVVGPVSAIQPAMAFMAIRNLDVNLLRKMIQTFPDGLAAVKNDEGQTLLRAAVRLERSDESDNAKRDIIRLLLESNCDPFEVDHLGKPLFEEWSESPIFNYFHCPELIVVWIRSGIDVSTRYSNGMNALHLHIHSPSNLEAMLVSATSSLVDTALDALNDFGYTPFTWALKEGQGESAKALYRAEPKSTWTCPESLSCLAVKAGAEEVLVQLVKDGCQYDADLFPMQFLHHEATVQFVHFLDNLGSGEMKTLVQGRYPFEHWLTKCINSSYDIEDFDEDLQAVLEALTKPWIQSFDATSLSNIWERVVVSFLDFQKKILSREMTNLVLMVTEYMAEVSAVSCYESLQDNCAIMPLLQRIKWTKKTLEDLLPFGTEAVSMILSHTTRWSTFAKTQEAVRLLVSSVKSREETICELLTQNGISPNDRVQGESALEAAAGEDCLNSIFEMMVRSSDPTHLDDLNPHSGKALLHFLHDEEKIEILLDNGAKIDVRERDNNTTPLLHHIRENFESMAKLLIERGADPFACDGWGFNAILEVAFTGNETILDILITSHEPPRILSAIVSESHYLPPGSKYKQEIDVTGATVLHVAAVRGNIGIVKLCLHHLSSEDICRVSREGWAAIHFAAAGGSSDIIKLLRADSGADVNTRDEEGNFPLHAAAHNHHLDAVTTLLELGSHLGPNNDGITPLHFALESENKALVQTILDAANKRPHQSSSLIIEHKGVRKAREMLELAVRANNTRLCEQLHNDGHSLNIDLVGCGCCSLLIAALKDSTTGVFLWLLENGSSTLKKDCNNQSMVHDAIKSPACDEILSALLDRHYTQGGQIAPDLPMYLLTAINAKSQHALGSLLDHVVTREGISASELADLINMPINEYGQTCLHRAVAKGNLEGMKTLFRYGSRANAPDKWLESPLHYVKAECQDTCSDLIATLCSEGAVLECRDIYDDTPLRTAIDRSLFKAKQAFYAAGAAMQYLGDHKSSGMWPWGNSWMGADTYIEAVWSGCVPHAATPDGCSLWHAAARFDHLASLLLNSDVDISRITAFPWEIPTIQDDWLCTKFRLFRKRIPLDLFQHIANVNPESGWSPLCRFSCLGCIEGMENVLSLGAGLDFEGCRTGSALMVASERGQFKSIKFLVRRGASISYHGPKGFRSALDLAAKVDGDIVEWILVGRHQDQKKLTDLHHNDGPGDNEIRPWSGVQEVEMTIGVSHARNGKTTELEYLLFLEQVKKGWRGRVIPDSRMTDCMA